MNFYFSNMYDNSPINDFEDLKKRDYFDKVILHLDSNICIYLRDFYDIPTKFQSTGNEKIVNELKLFLKSVKENNVEVNYSLGVEESCRNKQNFQINSEKAMQMIKSIESILSMDYFQVIEHEKLIKPNNQSKDFSNLPISKIDNLEVDSSFKDVLTIMYASLLKLYLLDKKSVSIKKHELMIEYLDFLDEDIDMISPSYILLGHYFFSETSKMKKMIHPKKKETIEILQAIWNASIDLCLTVLVPSRMRDDHQIPIFVTADEKLHKIISALQIKAIFDSGEKSMFPPIIEIDLEKVKWNNEQFRILSDYERKISSRRKDEYLLLAKYEESYKNKLIENARGIIKKLEGEISEYTLGR